MLLGVVAAIAAAFSWTSACFIWRSETRYFSSHQINLIKTFLATLIFLPVVYSIGWNFQIRSVAILLTSGVIGIALGDSLYISALKRIGTRRTLSVEAVSPIVANLFGALFIGESLSIKNFLGALLVTISLVLIANQKDSSFPQEPSRYYSSLLGYGLASLSVILAVVGAILSRHVLINTDLSPLQTTEIRLLGALTVLLITNKINFVYTLKNIPFQDKFKLLLATALGTNFGILFQQTVFLTLPIGVGWTLLSCSPIISLFFARFEGDKINKMSIIYSLITFFGVAIACI